MTRTISRGVWSLLICVVPCIAAVGSTAVYTAATDDLMGRALRGMEIPFEQITDEQRDPIWGFESRGILVTVIPHDTLGDGRYGSLMFYAAWSTDQPFEFSAINNWNRFARFGRAYVDDQGDPVVELDLLLSGGVTLETVQAYIEIFVDTAQTVAALLR